MASPADLTVAERIRDRFQELTRAERQLANAILANYPVSGLGSITALAETSGVSTPTAVRMAKFSRSFMNSARSSAGAMRSSR